METVVDVAQQNPEARAEARRPGAVLRRIRTGLFALVVLVTLVARPAVHHAHALSLLLSFAGGSAGKDARPLAEARGTFEAGGRSVPMRTYAPAGATDLPGIVMVHGVHFRGIEEPRLERFARAVAREGYVVMTPQVDELADYQVAPRSIDTVGAAAEHLRTTLHVRKVGLMGMSFGGGVALLAAADPRFAEDVAFVVAIGAHDDLARVSRFFATNEIAPPSGPTRPFHAHEYGATVLVYSRVEAFFPAEDVPAARHALRSWLHEDREDARKAAADLSPAARAKVEKLFAADIASLRDEMLAVLAREEDAMKQVSPHGRLAGLRADVFLLHGDHDSVIPATETLWLAEDVPREHLRHALVSPAIQHVEIEKPSLADEWALVHFMGDVLAEADRTR